MKIATAFAVALLMGCTAALAQQANPYEGTWRAEFESQKGTSLEGTVVIKDQGGTWDMLVLSKKNPCIGRAVPITVRQATADELVFEINRSKALTGCQDGLANLKRVDDKTLEGEFDAGRKIKLIRQ